MNNTKKKWLIGSLFLITVIYVLRFTNISETLTFENLIKNKNKLNQFVEENYLKASMAYVLIYFAVITMGLPGGAIMSLAGGFLFGAVVAVIYINIGASFGAILSFTLARYVLGDWLQNKYSDKLIKLNKEIEENGANYMLTLRLIPVFPFFLINLLSGLTNIKLRVFAWTTIVGIIPGSFVYAYAGSNLSKINALEDVLSPGIILALIFLGILSLTPSMVKKIKKR